MRHQCIVCGSRLPQKAVFTLENAPASAQNIPGPEEVSGDAGMTLGLYRCAECGLVQIDCEPVDYYRDVIRAGGFSATMTELRRHQYAHMIEKYGLTGKRFVEAGCGRGEFLKVLTEFSVEAYGMEHKADLVKTAQSEGLNVWREFPEIPDQIFLGNRAEMIPAAIAQKAGCREPFDVFLSFNFLEHQPQPSVMLRAIRENLADDGMGLVTVPALEYIVEQGSYYELIHDHIAYYSFDALRELLVRSGFSVLEEELVNRDTIAMIVRKAPDAPYGKAQSPDAGDAMTDALLKGYENVQRETDALIRELAADGKSLAVWGASHQGFTLTATTALRTYVKYIIDSAPFKQGRFAPASHLPIVAPEHFFSQPVDAILIVAPGYSDEIAGIIRGRFGNGVRILTIRSDKLEELT